jgi:hypothetical protein
MASDMPETDDAAAERAELRDAATVWTGRQRALTPLGIRPRTVEAAAALRDAGADTPHLRLLAALPTSAPLDEFEETLDNALHELGLSRRRPEPEVSASLLAAAARDQRSGRVGPRTVAAWAVGAGGRADPVLRPLAELFDRLGAAQAQRDGGSRDDQLAEIDQRIIDELARATG